MMAKKEQLTMADWMLSVERRLTAMEATHHAAAIKLRELANCCDTTLSGTRVTCARLCELADLLDGGDSGEEVRHDDL